jgi:predicted membrane protein
MEQDTYHNEHKEEFKQAIKEKAQYYQRKAKKGRIGLGIIILFVGLMLLFRSMGLLFFPTWIFTWPMILILIGVFSGIRHGFRKGFWALPIIIGLLFLLNETYPSLNLNHYIAPIIIISVGLLFIFRTRGPMHHYRMEYRNEDEMNASDFGSQDISPDRKDFIDITSVFGGVKKNILSKTFKGGDILCFMGGADINLMQADFNGQIKIDATNIFGGTKLIVPPTWDIQSEVVAIFGGVEDKRQINTLQVDPSKVIILDGTCLFGGIEIRNY